MKKLSIVTIALMVLAGIAYASSLGVPWFVDNAPLLAGYPPSSNTTGIIYLKNTTNADITASIGYYNGNGDFLGPCVEDADFLLPKNSTIPFRPVAINDVGLGGMEGPVGAAIPDRPRSNDVGSPIPCSLLADGTGPVVTDNAKVGSCTITWDGSGTDVQGFIMQIGLGASADAVISYAHLLPPGT